MLIFFLADLSLSLCLQAQVLVLLIGATLDVKLGFSFQDPVTDLGTGKGFSRPTEVPQLSVPHLKEELESDTNQQNTGLELTPQHTCPALRFLHQSSSHSTSPYKSSQQGTGEGGEEGAGLRYLAWHPWKYRVRTEWPSSCFA